MHRLCLTLIACLLCSCATTRQRREAVAIEDVFAADRAVSVQAFHGKEIAKLSSRTAATAINQYSRGLRQIDMSKTPTDFQVAYLEHVQAWESLSEEMTRKPEAADIGALSGLISAVAAHAHPIAAAALAFLGNDANKASRTIAPSRNELKEAAHRRIRETWNKIELVAVEHGVDLRKQAAAEQRR